MIVNTLKISEVPTAMRAGKPTAQAAGSQPDCPSE
jgi:hypothetical protein